MCLSEASGGERQCRIGLGKWCCSWPTKLNKCPFHSARWDPTLTRVDAPPVRTGLPSWICGRSGPKLEPSCWLRQADRHRPIPERSWTPLRSQQAYSGLKPMLNSNSIGLQWASATFRYEALRFWHSFYLWCIPTSLMPLHRSHLRSAPLQFNYIDGQIMLPENASCVCMGLVFHHRQARPNYEPLYSFLK